MLNVTQDSSEAELAKSKTIREVCEQAAEPAQIWEALESKGIEATPGEVYQAMSDPGHGENKSCGKPIIAKTRLDGVIGLTVDDIQTIATLAEKVGGVEELIRILSVVDRTPR